MRVNLLVIDVQNTIVRTPGVFKFPSLVVKHTQVVVSPFVDGIEIYIGLQSTHSQVDNVHFFHFVQAIGGE